MADYFTNTDDLIGWIKSRKSSNDAAVQLTEVIKLYNNVNNVSEINDIQSMCHDIYEKQGIENEAKELMGILAKNKILTLRKEASNMNRQAQSRQRNEWQRGDRGKWNRAVDGYKETTPWRINRDQFYDFTHNTIDAISFDADPSRVYSGEALWRMYVMDKFTREYQDKDGKWVGGYINDRFHVFPYAGTPGNPKVARDGGNQMQLAPGERTRKPRPHQWSVERRLEEARGNKLNDLEASSFKKMTKIASKIRPERTSDKVYGIFCDTIDMKEAGISYVDRLNKISDHYDVAITSVAQIDKVASSMIKKHDGIGYEIHRHAQSSTLQVQRDIVVNGINEPIGAGTSVVLVGIDNYQVVDGPFAGMQFKLDPNIAKQTLQQIDNSEENIQDASSELGLNDEDSGEISPSDTL